MAALSIQKAALLLALLIIQHSTSEAFTAIGTRSIDVDVVRGELRTTRRRSFALHLRNAKTNPYDEPNSNRNIDAKNHGNDNIQTNSVKNNNISIERYQHNNFNVTYLYKPPSSGRENDKPIILIHPVGIGLSSWFWLKVMENYEVDNPPIYAPDLIGCGLNHGADAWDPSDCGLFFPLSWVEGVETLLETVVLPRWRKRNSVGGGGILSNLFGGDDNNSGGGCLVVAQGGLAPVGIMLAKRNPFQIQTLMLTSPPTYDVITTPIPQTELERNYNFLTSPILGSLAFRLLENRSIIRFFSDAFLFAKPTTTDNSNGGCDERWLDETEKESSYLINDKPMARTPVQAFNAGLLQHRSFEEELKEMVQPIWVISGVGDKRVIGREGYRSELGEEKCTLRSIDGLNVLPWENPSGVIELMKELGY